MTQIPVSYVPLAPIHLVKSNGNVKPYGLGVTSDSAAGTALLSAIAAYASGDTVRAFSNASISSGISSSSLRLVDAVIDSSSAAAPTITLTGSSVILENCRFTTNGSETYSISAASPYTLTIVGSLHVNKPLHTNITVSGGPVVINGVAQLSAFGTTGAVTFNDAGADVDFRVEGDTLSHMLFLDASSATENIALVTGSAPNWQSMDGGLFIGSTATAPTGNPTSGAFLWSDAGTLKTRTSGGAIRTLGAEIRTIQVMVVSPVTSVSTGDGKAYIHIPASLNGGVITAVHAKVITAGTTGTTDIQIANVTDAVDVLSTKLTIDTTETGSDTATPAVINTSNDDLATNDLLRIDVDAISTTAPLGLIVTIEVTI